MPDPIEDTKVWSPEDVDAVRRDLEEEDESGVPDKVAWPDKDEDHSLESARRALLRTPRNEQE